MKKNTMITLMVVCAGIFTSGKISAGVENLEIRAYKISHDLRVPGKPEAIFDALTGDISGWWDHSFSEKPKALYIEPKPGGVFMEIFDDAGNGAQHATVIAADRGKLLRFEGPLGLSGKAVQLVSSFELTAVGSDSTHIKFELHGSGELNDKLINIVDGVWHHFLFEQFKPYIETQNQQK